MLGYMKNDRLGIFAAIAFGATAVTACGSETSAADSAEQSEGEDAEIAEKPDQATKGGTTASALPIEQGIYGHIEEGGCAGATQVFFYDGSSYGTIRHADGSKASVDTFRIERIGSFTSNDFAPTDKLSNFDGFKKVLSTETGKPDEFGDITIEFVGIKSAGKGKFIKRVGGTGIKTGKYGRVDETFEKCSVAQLPQRMQAAVREKLPKLAGGAAPTAAKASIAFPPIPQGFYAYGSTCTEAIASGAGGDPPIGLVLFTAKAIGEWDGAMQISGFEDIGKSRFRVKGRSYGNGDDPVGEQSDFTIRVTGPSSFVDERMQEEHTHCPNVAANVRDQYM